MSLSRLSVRFSHSIDALSRLARSSPRSSMPIAVVVDRVTRCTVHVEPSLQSRRTTARQLLTVS